MKDKRIREVLIEGAQIFARNFSGKPGRFNAEGIRGFCVRLDLQLADELLKDGWKINRLGKRNPDDEEIPYLPVRVRYDNFPPKIVIINSKNKTMLGEDEIHILDWAEIENVDLVLNPYNWEVNGKKGIKAYLKTMYVTIHEDEFEAKYRDIPDSALSSLLKFEEHDNIPF